MTRPILEPIKISDDLVFREGTTGNNVVRVVCSIQMISMFLVVLHATAMPFIVRVANKTHFLATISVVFMEVLKLLFCLMITWYNAGSFKKFCDTVFQAIWSNRKETLKVAVPAIVYAIQNNLYYIALENVDPTTYSVTLQLRILTTAILSVLLLNKQLSWIQWGAQLIVLIGVMLVQLDKKSSNQLADPNETRNYMMGVIAVIGMCWTSAFAGVYFEKMLKNSKADLWIQNIRLSLLTLFFALVTAIVTDAEKIYENGLFQGWTWMVWFVTFLNSVGGLCVSLVVKYADNVMKTYCQSIAIGLTSLVSIFLGERTLSQYLVYGVVMVTSSVVIYSCYPAEPKDYKPAEVKVSDKEDLVGLLETGSDDNME